MKMKRAIVVVTSIVYSAFLAISALFMAGAGDGSYVLLGLFFAPFSLIMFLLGSFGIPLGGLLLLIGMPALWITAALLGTIRDKKKRRICLGIFLLVHYASAAVVLQIETYCNWRKFHLQTAGAIGTAIILFILLVYLLGQIWLWLQLVRSFRFTKHREQDAQNGS